MSAPQTAVAIPFSAPVKGMNTRDPLPLMDPLYAPLISGFEPYPQSLKVRNGHIFHIDHSVEFTPASSQRMRGLDLSPLGDKLIAWFYDSANPKILDVSTAGAVTTIKDFGTITPVSNVGSTHHAGNLFFGQDVVSGGVQSGRYDGSTWTNWGFTDGSSAIYSDVLLSYKGRLYIFPRSSSVDTYYSTIGGLTGACTAWATGSLLPREKTVWWAGVLAAPSGQTNETYLVFGNQVGDVLVYAGDYPGAANWEQVAKATISYIPYQNACLQYNNDLLVVTTTGVVSIRKLLQLGGDSPDIYISSAINSYITTLFSGINAVDYASAPVQIGYWSQRNQIYILTSSTVDTNGVFDEEGTTLLVWNEISDAWTISQITPSASHAYAECYGKIVNFAGSLYYISRYDIKKVGTGFKDQTATATFSAYDINLQSAYTSLGSTNRYKKIASIEPIINTDFAADKVGVQVSSDFGRKTSDVSYVSILQSGFNLPTYNLGIQGTYLQYRFTGSSDTSATNGYEIFSIGISIK